MLWGQSATGFRQGQLALDVEDNLLLRVLGSQAVEIVIICVVGIFVSGLLNIK